MKKQYMGVIARLLVLVMVSAALAGCGSKEGDTLDTVDPFKYVTLGDYEGLKIDAIDTTVSDGDIQANIDNVLRAQAEAKEVTGRAAKLGDTVNIDYIGTENGVPFDGGTGNYDLELGSGSFIPGFEEGVVGMNTGDTKVLELTFPEDYHSTDLAGKAVEFEVTVNSISENVLPELTDEFIKGLDTDATTVEGYRESIRAALTEQKEASAKANIQSKLLQMAVENAEFDEDKLPEWLVSQNATGYRESTEAMVAQYGVDFASYLEQTGKTEEEFDTEAREYAKEISGSQLVVLAIAKQQGLSVTDKDMEDYYVEYAANYGASVDMIKDAIPKDELKNYLLQQKVMDYLYSEAIFNK